MFFFDAQSPDALPDRLAIAQGRRFRVATHPLAGYEVVARKAVGQVLPMDGDAILLLEKRTY